MRLSQRRRRSVPHWRGRVRVYYWRPVAGRPGVREALFGQVSLVRIVYVNSSSRVLGSEQEHFRESSSSIVDDRYVRHFWLEYMRLICRLQDGMAEIVGVLWMYAEYSCSNMRSTCIP